tara:strand:+ start:124 stop:477 length:354 start_codon:yes stop_codon:yes gene_type:complete
MATFFFILFHFIAVIFGFWMLLISIPLHMFYVMSKNNAENLSADIKQQTEILKEQKNDSAKTLEANEELYEQISNELESNQIDKGLWTQAEAESDGDEKKVRSVYIKLRYEKLTKDA